MNSKVIYIALWFVLLPLLQGLVFNHIYLFGYINPQVYVLFVVIFPFLPNKSWILLLSFAMGLWIDFLNNEGGMHAFSLIFIAYIREFLLKLVSSSRQIDHAEINLNVLPSGTLYLWIFLLALIHHTLLFSLEQFSFIHIGHLMIKIALTSILTTIILIIFMELGLKSRRV